MEDEVGWAGSVARWEINVYIVEVVKYERRYHRGNVLW
jgi:hypothetical protein